MTRTPRVEYPGALYHVTARGVQRGAIFLDDSDRRQLVRLLASTMNAGNAHAFAYCLMGNHYHFVIQTREANLSALMHRINSSYSQAFNRRHQRAGHLLEGRFKAIHVDREDYLLEVCRYVELNPVRTGLVETPTQWEWSSYRAHVGRAPPLPWLATAELLAVLTGRQPRGETEFGAAQREYVDWVEAGRGARLWSESLHHGQYLGNDAFVQRMMGGAS